MSMRLRYYLSIPLGMVAQEMYPHHWVDWNPRFTKKWYLTDRGYLEIIRVHFDLPDEIEYAYQLRLAAGKIWRDQGGRVATSAYTLLAKVCNDLGLSYPGGLPADMDPTERRFYDIIHDEPGNLCNWSAFCDWLQEHRPRDKRAEIMARWLSPKRFKTIRPNG